MAQISVRGACGFVLVGNTELSFTPLGILSVWTTTQPLRDRIVANSGDPIGYL